MDAKAGPLVCMSLCAAGNECLLDRTDAHSDSVVGSDAHTVMGSAAMLQEPPLLTRHCRS